MKFPFEATTKNGEKVTITGHYAGYKHPWCGFLDMKLGAKTFSVPLNWADDGTYPEHEISELDLIDLPK